MVFRKIKANGDELLKKMIGIFSCSAAQCQLTAHVGAMHGFDGSMSNDCANCRISWQASEQIMWDEDERLLELLKKECPPR